MSTADKAITFAVASSSTTPTWIDTAIAGGWTVGTWARISGPSPTHGLSVTNTIRSVKTVDPSDSRFQGIIKNWSGGWLAPNYGTYGSFGVGVGGGHGDNSGYTGNDVFRFDLGTRLWSEIHARQSGAVDQTFGDFANGSTQAMHTYFTWAATPALPGHPSGMLVIGRSSADSGLATPQAARPYGRSFDLATKVWTRLDQIPGSATRNCWTQACSGIWDTTRSRYWLWAIANNGQTNTTFAALNPLAAAGSQWAETRPANSGGGHGWSSQGIEQVLVHDTVRDVIITLDYRTVDGAKYLFPGSPGTFFANNPTGFPITETGTPPVKSEGGGIDWSTKDNCAYYWTGATTSTVYKFAYASGSVGSQGVSGNLAYNWSMITNTGANTVTPVTQVDNDGKTYNRFRVARYGNTQIAVTVTDVDGAVYAFRIS